VNDVFSIASPFPPHKQKVSKWNEHPNPSDSHPLRIGFPLRGGPFLCTQGEGGGLTHFFSGNLHAIDFRCPIGTELLAVADGIVVESKDTNTLTGIAVTNLFEWNSILLEIHTNTGDEGDNNHNNNDVEHRSNIGDPVGVGGPLFVEYVHIQKSLVKVGDRVARGQVIGYSGSVGFSPEPHLHFSAFRSSDPQAPTVRVHFQSARNGKGGSATDQTFLPRAGAWYDESGKVR
jgi:murein DD-endopeptidase MepM/ murein hydrolase activator NlpD